MTTTASHGPNGAIATSASSGAYAHAASSNVEAARSSARVPEPQQPGGALPALPSAAAIALAHASRRELERALQRGVTPELDLLLGWEFRGINATPPGEPPIARLAG